MSLEQLGGGVMKNCWRFRTSFTGKLTLQRCVEYSYSEFKLVSSESGKWRDALTEDLIDFINEFKD